MKARFVAEEGPTKGTLFSLEGEEPFILGRDPDESNVFVEDPTVSRKHLSCTQTPDGYLIENLSETNPVRVNGAVLDAPILMQEGDQVQIGDTLLIFTQQEELEVVLPPEDEFEEEEEGPYDTIFGEEEASVERSEGKVDLSIRSRFFLKVVTGPNTGAELSLEPGHSYMLGTDGATCDIVFHDLSISRQHARLIVSEEETLEIEDLKSRNGVIVDGKPIEHASIGANSVCQLGTTSFIVIDREAAQQTIAAMVPLKEREAPPEEEPSETPMPAEAMALPSPTRPILSGGAFILIIIALALVVVVVASTLTLFKGHDVVSEDVDYSKDLKKALAPFPDVRYQYNKATNRLFILGNVLTGVDKSELLYNIDSLGFVSSTEDKVVVNQYVWEEWNNILAKNSNWAGVSMHAPEAGHYVLSGSLKTRAQYDSLTDYMQLHFSFLDRLKDEVVVEELLSGEAAAHVLNLGLNDVHVAVTNGDLVLTGYIGKAEEGSIKKLIEKLSEMRGVRTVKDFVIVVAARETFVDLSGRYQVQGFSKRDDTTINVLIDGQIVGKGDSFQGMTATAITPHTIILEKGGVKYKIDYNQQ